MRCLRLLGLFAIVAIFIVTSCYGGRLQSRLPGWRFLGPESARITVLELDWPYLYAGGLSDGLFRTNISGGSAEWQDLSTHVQDVEVLADGTILVARALDLVRSDDKGVTWSRSDSGMALDDGWSRVNCLLKTGSMLYAGTHRLGLYKSDDDGLSWTIVAYDTLVAYHELDGHADSLGTMYAICDIRTRRFVQISQDQGSTWRRVHKAEMLDARPFSLTVDPTDNSVAYVGLDRGGVVKTSDGGKSWEQLPRLHRYAIYAFAHDQRRSGHLFIAGGAGRGEEVPSEEWLFRTRDGGCTISLIAAPKPEGSRALLYDVDRRMLYASSGRGVYTYCLE